MERQTCLISRYQTPYLGSAKEMKGISCMELPLFSITHTWMTRPKRRWAKNISTLAHICIWQMQCTDIMNCNIKRTAKALLNVNISAYNLAVAVCGQTVVKLQTLWLLMPSLEGNVFCDHSDKACLEESDICMLYSLNQWIKRQK